MTSQSCSKTSRARKWSLAVTIRRTTRIEEKSSRAHKMNKVKVERTGRVARMPHRMMERRQTKMMAGSNQ